MPFWRNYSFRNCLELSILQLSPSALAAKFTSGKIETCELGRNLLLLTAPREIESIRHINILLIFGATLFLSHAILSQFRSIYIITGMTHVHILYTSLSKQTRHNKSQAD